ncbi:hypothetical protein GCM10008957_42520 [Deinococcus ruber]|uniref:Uncharacterized protein n=1 Tax=Deinococcus ruber TaxID=1848197 RepID=A0A918CL05_9DEIO|nr:hypothetical protein GCM10008957_42520 [Deinococcus ruber]
MGVLNDLRVQRPERVVEIARRVQLPGNANGTRCSRADQHGSRPSKQTQTFQTFAWRDVNLQRRAAEGALSFELPDEERGKSWLSHQLAQATRAGEETGKTNCTFPSLPGGPIHAVCLVA